MIMLRQILWMADLTCNKCKLLYLQQPFMWGHLLYYITVHVPKERLPKSIFNMDGFHCGVSEHRMNKKPSARKDNHSFNYKEKVSMGCYIKYPKFISREIFKLSLAEIGSVKTVTKQREVSLNERLFTRWWTFHYCYTLHTEPSFHFWKQYKSLHHCHTMCQCLSLRNSWL